MIALRCHSDPSADGEESRPEYFQGSRSCPLADGHPETMKMAAVAIVGPRRCLGPGAIRRIAPTICRAAIFRAVRDSSSAGAERSSAVYPPASDIKCRASGWGRHQRQCLPLSARQQGEIRFSQFLLPPEQAHGDKETSMIEKRTPEFRSVGRQTRPPTGRRTIEYGTVTRMAGEKTRTRHSQWRAVRAT